MPFPLLSVTVHLIGFLFQISSIGCKQATLEEELHILETMELNPATLFQDCAGFKHERVRTECWNSAARIITSSTELDRVCVQLNGTAQSECYFQGAERLNDPILCGKAKGFELDCRTHILQQNCGRFTSPHALMQYAQTLNLDGEHRNIAGLIHRCLLDHKPIVPILYCRELPFTEECEHMALELFQRKIGQQQCAQIQQMKTFNHPILEQSKQDALSKKCPKSEK